MRFLVSVCLVLVAASAHAETIAMLPLDAEKRLEIYSQPVAGAIAQGLKGVGLDVVVITANMAVPKNAQLIVDGAITKGKGKDVTVAIRIRDPRDGTVLENVPPQTAPIDNIDKAASELSARVVPLVQSHLAELAKKAAAEKQPPPVEGKPPVATQPLVIAAVAVDKKQTGAQLELLADALGKELGGWAHEQHHEVKLVDRELLDKKAAVKTIGDNHTDAGIAFEVLGIEIEKKDGIPFARARVRVRIASAAEVKFERIIHTDTVVGDKGMADAALVPRVARAVLAITTPNLRRALVTWQR